MIMLLQHENFHNRLEIIIFIGTHLDGKMDGNRPRGRTPRRWLDQITEIIHLPLQEDAIRETEDSSRWQLVKSG